MEIVNKEKLATVKNNIRQAGPYKLHVLADFDRTLTMANVDGKPISSIISVLRDGNYLTPDYAPKAHALFNYYAPIEKNSNISLNEKKKAMEQWWRKHFELLLQSGLILTDVKKAIESANIQLRPGVDKFFETLQKFQIPLIIMSASGLGTDAINLYLNKLGYLTPNIHIISNVFIWDANGKAISIKEPIVHSLNKDETVVQNYPEIFSEVQNRKNVILLGDNPEDIAMVTGFETENLIKIGFLNEAPNPDNLKPYQKNYDIIITDDGSFKGVNNLLTEIL